MDYNKITINFTPFQEWLRDVLTSQLGEVGFESFVETKSGFEAFIPVKNYSEENLNFVLNEFHKDFTFSVSTEIIKSQNWNEVWEKNYFKPLVVAGECVIRAPFHTDYPKAKYEIIIEPNMAFGTGNHETTSLVIESILENSFNDKSVLDMGCGTGILGILASMKGAENITAIDIDEWSYNGTKENAELNNINNINVKLGDFVNAGALLYVADDLSKAKVEIFLPIDKAKVQSSKVIYINGKETTYKINKLYKVADIKHISSYKCEIIIDAPKKFSELVKIEFNLT